MGRSRRRPASQGKTSKAPSPMKAPLGLSPADCLSSSFGWLRRILASAELEDHFEAAAAWADQTGCIQNDLSHEECLQELIDHLALKKFQAMRVRNACDAFASALVTCGGGEDVHSESTAASVTEASNVLAAETVSKELAAAEAPVEMAQRVLVEFDGLPYSAEIQHRNADGTLRVIYDVDGTYEDVDRQRVSVLAKARADAEDASESQTETDDVTEGQAETELEGQAKISKSAKKRARKQVRDAAHTATQKTETQQQSLQSSRVKNLLPQQSLQSSRATTGSKLDVIDEELMVWSESREGCKARAELMIPNKCVGWIIGKNGSTIKHIEQAYLVTVQLVSQTVSIYGKRERVKQARSYIDQLLWEGF